MNDNDIELIADTDLNCGDLCFSYTANGVLFVTKWTHDFTEPERVASRDIKKYEKVFFNNFKNTEDFAININGIIKLRGN